MLLDWMYWRANKENIFLISSSCNAGNTYLILLLSILYADEIHDNTIIAFHGEYSYGILFL